MKPDQAPARSIGDQATEVQDPDAELLASVSGGAGLRNPDPSRAGPGTEGA